MHSRLRRASAIMAILYGVGLSGFETLINWGQWQWWPWWLVDYVAAAILIAGGIASLRNGAVGPALLFTGWGFALGMMWMSLAGNIAQGTAPDRAARVAGLYVALICASMAYCFAGLCLSLAAYRHQSQNQP
ncbi:hypothetical protein [Pontixanthobacter sp.]|uniref:hypothetical protein n=1 Tax=Pontixanthobacter sp. TaxID=2792078 RepID=UPI003C7A54AF